MSEKRLELQCEIGDRDLGRRLAEVLNGYLSSGKPDFTVSREVFNAVGVDTGSLFCPENEFEISNCTYDDNGALNLEAAAGAFSGSDIFEALIEALGKAGARKIDALLYCSMTGTVTRMDWNEAGGVSFIETDLPYPDD